MRLFFEPALEGLSTDDLGALRLWQEDIYTEQDLEELCQTRCGILRQMRDCMEVSDIDGLDRLDPLYDDLCAAIDAIAAHWPTDYRPDCLDARYLY